MLMRLLRISVLSFAAYALWKKDGTAVNSALVLMVTLTTFNHEKRIYQLERKVNGG